jgi:hypothetical protein
VLGRRAYRLGGVVVQGKVKRIAAGFRKFAHYRLRVLLHAGGCNWDLLGT